MKYNKSNIELFLNDLTTKNMMTIIHSDDNTILQNNRLFESSDNKKKTKRFRNRIYFINNKW